MATVMRRQTRWIAYLANVDRDAFSHVVEVFVKWLGPVVTMGRGETGEKHTNLGGCWLEQR